MDDNAASHETRDSEVHPDPSTEVNDETVGEKSRSPKPSTEGREVTQDEPKDDAGSSSPRPLAAPSPPPAPAAQASPAPEPVSAEEASNSAIESLFLNAEYEQGLDPDTLANLAALSRLPRDEGEGEYDEGGEGGAGGYNDFSTLVPEPRESDPRDTMTTEQMHELVARLAQPRDDEEEDGDQDAEGEDDMEGEGEDRQHTPGDMKVKHQREDSEALQEVDEDRKSNNGAEDDQKPEGRGRKRKRNRTVLSCTECHRRCDRNIPCSRCIQRGVPALCRMDAPILPYRKKKKRSELHITQELRMRVQALEQLIKSGLTFDADQATLMATEAVHQATRASQSGSTDATNALAQLTRSSIGSGIGGMSSEAQNLLLRDVLQQLAGQGKGRDNEDYGDEPEDGQGAWSTVPRAVPLGAESVHDSFERDTADTKVDLSLAGFREDSGKIFIPPTVRHVEKTLRNERNLLLDPLPIHGLDSFLDVGTRLAYGPDTPAYRKERICSIQSYSITGAMRLASTFISRFPASSSGRAIYVPSPSSPEDLLAVKHSGMEIRQFRFLDYKNGGIDWEGLREDLSSAPTRSAVLLHVSGSMPTGAEFTAPQWRHLTSILLQRQHIPLVVMASQGLASGDVNRDAQPLRFMIHEGVPVVLIQSFDSMMGIHSDSPSIVSVVVRNLEEKERVNSQLRASAREMYLHPSPWGAHVVHAILSSPKLYAAWLNEIKAMSDRLRSVRDKLHDVIANKLKTPGEWAHIKRATGMYISTLLPPGRCEALASKRHIYILPEGCVSLGALNAVKIDMLARGIDQVVRDGIKEADDAREQAIAMELALQAAKEQAAREEAEAAAAAALAEEERAREEDTLMMERSIATAMEAQKRLEEEEKMREEADREMVETLRKAEERALIARQAEAILAQIQGGSERETGKM